MEQPLSLTNNLALVYSKAFNHQCLKHEITLKKISFTSEVVVPAKFKSVEINGCIHNKIKMLSK